MKKIVVVTLSLWGSVLYGQTGTVILQVEGIDAKKGGQLSAGIFREENFPKVGKQFRGTEIKITANKMEVRLNDIPVGSYGAAVFHDIDKNKDLKANFLGLPQEPIGFSNDARIKFGPPSFEDAQFMVEKDKEVILQIILR